MQTNKPTRSSRLTTLRLVMGGVGQKGDASSPFGPLRVGLIHTQDHDTLTESRDQQLTELLNCLERKIAELNSRYSEVSDIFIRDTARLANLSVSITSTTITEEESDE